MHITPKTKPFLTPGRSLMNQNTTNTRHTYKPKNRERVLIESDLGVAEPSARINALMDNFLLHMYSIHTDLSPAIFSLLPSAAASTSWSCSPYSLYGRAASSGVLFAYSSMSNQSSARARAFQTLASLGESGPIAWILLCIAVQKVYFCLQIITRHLI